MDTSPFVPARCKERTEATKIGVVRIQIVRHWVINANAMAARLIDRKADGQPPGL